LKPTATLSHTKSDTMSQTPIGTPSTTTGKLSLPLPISLCVHFTFAHVSVKGPFCLLPFGVYFIIN